MSLKIAIIGLSHGVSHLHVIQGQPRLELVAVVDRDLDRARHIATKHGVPHAFNSVEELVASGLAEAAVVAVPTPAHAAVSEALLGAGLHVLQEKPLSCNDVDAARIGAAVRASSAVFQVGYEVRSSALHQAMLEHIARGDLGQLTNIWYHQHTLETSTPDQWRASRANMGGKLFDCAVHYFDLMRQWAGAPVYRVCAFGNLVGQVGAMAEGLPQTCTVILEYANGVRGTYNFGEVNALNDDASFGLAGTTGRIMGTPWLPQGAGSYELRTHRGRRVGQLHFDAKLTSPGHLGFKEQMDNFVATVLDGAPNVCTYEDAHELHRQMAAIDRSLASGLPELV